MEKEKITYQFADTGHWLARCNHQSNVIELNALEYGSLSPLMQDYIWVHECVHLLTDITDEAECNRLTDEIFISRAKSNKDKYARITFVNSANNQSFTRVKKPASDKMFFFALILIFVLLFKKNIL